MKTPVHPARAPEPKGPYTPAIVASGRMLYVSGQGPVDPDTQEFVLDSFQVQARLTLRNVQAVVEAGGGSLADAVKVTVYLRDMDNFGELNTIYAEFFPEPRPARTTCQSDLPGFEIEVDAIVVLPD